MKTVTPERAAELVKSGAVLIDIRETAEHAGENIPGARHHALSQIDAKHPVRAGNMNAQKLAGSAGQCEVYLLGGGIEAWKRAGLPTSAKSARASGKAAAARRPGGLINRIAALFR
jgi:rhodanese-related sulfurtransferase